MTIEHSYTQRFSRLGRLGRSQTSYDDRFPTEAMQAAQKAMCAAHIPYQSLLPVKPFIRLLVNKTQEATYLRARVASFQHDIQSVVPYDSFNALHPKSVDCSYLLSELLRKLIQYYSEGYITDFIALPIFTEHDVDVTKPSDKPFMYFQIPKTKSLRSSSGMLVSYRDLLGLITFKVEVVEDKSRIKFEISEHTSGEVVTNSLLSGFVAGGVVVKRIENETINRRQVSNREMLTDALGVALDNYMAGIDKPSPPKVAEFQVNAVEQDQPPTESK